MFRRIAALPTSSVEFDSSWGSPPDCLSGRVFIANTPFQVLAVRLVNRRGRSVGGSAFGRIKQGRAEVLGEQGLPVNASDEAARALRHIRSVDDGYLETVKIPGQSGNWALAVFPYAE
jgi:hypothetical protein